MAELPSPADVVAFWREAGPARWWAHDDAFDAQIRERFHALHMQAATGALNGWTDTADGALALVLALDQFPRNLHRDSAHAFATDPLARAAADRAMAQGHDLQHPPLLRAFFYLPLMHAEDVAAQARCVALFEALVVEAPETVDNLKFARLHADIITRFGRYPHRNKVLGRETTDEERAFLEGGGFAG